MKRAVRYLALMVILVCVMTRICVENYLVHCVMLVVLRVAIGLWAAYELIGALRVARGLFVCWVDGAKPSDLLRITYHATMRNLWCEVFDFLAYFLSGVLDTRIGGRVIMYVEQQIFRHGDAFATATDEAQPDAKTTMGVTPSDR